MPTATESRIIRVEPEKTIKDLVGGAAKIVGFRRWQVGQEA